MRPTEIEPPKIMVVEDSPADVLLLRHALDQHGEPYELAVLRDGAEALQFVAAQWQSPQESAPCVIVLDLHLPKHDGLSVLAALRREPGLSHIRVVALSVLQALETRLRSTRSGCACIARNQETWMVGSLWRAIFLTFAASPQPSPPSVATNAVNRRPR